MVLWVTPLSTTVERLLEMTWSNPSLYGGGSEAQRGEGPSPRSHSTSGAGPGIKPSLHSPVQCSSVLAPSYPLFPVAEPFSLPLTCFLGDRASGNGCLWVQWPLVAPAGSLPLLIALPPPGYWAPAPAMAGPTVWAAGCLDEGQESGILCPLHICLSPLMSARSQLR